MSRVLLHICPQNVFDQSTLDHKGFAYVADNEDVYFAVATLLRLW